MDIHHLKVFVSAFKNRSFSRASEELNLTQPTISNHIKLLENGFNCRLFNRSGRIIIPTTEAGILYKDSVELIERVNTLKETIGEIKKELSGKLVVGASTIPGVYLLPRMMSEFRITYPEISFQILISDSMGIVDSISKHKLAIGIVGAKLGNEQIKYTPFVEDVLIVVSSPSLVKSKRMTLRELAKLPMVFREEGSGTRRETERYLKGRGVSLDSIKIAGIFGSTDAVKQAVKAGLGVAILSKFSVTDELERQIIKEIKLTDAQIRRMLYVVTHRKRTLPKLYDKFLELILAESKNLN